MCEKCNGTGYEWQPDPDLKRYCMASVDTPEERAEAQALGWRTFMVVPEFQKDMGEKKYKFNVLAATDVLCPATDPHPRRGKVCEECEGAGKISHGLLSLVYSACDICNGTGRVPTTCAVCGLCRGTTARAPSIWEVAHGKNKENHKW